MHKPLVDTRWTRFKQLIRGLLFYNTIYWRRASDGLKPPRLTSEERRNLAPPKNLEVIRPRVKPRARIEESRRQQMIAELARLRTKMPVAMARKLPGGGETAPAPPTAAAPPVSRRSGAGTVAAKPAAQPPAVVSAEPAAAVSAHVSAGAHRTIRPGLDTPVRRRRRRRSSHPTEDQVPASGFMARLFGKKKA